MVQRLDGIYVTRYFQFAKNTDSVHKPLRMGYNRSSNIPRKHSVTVTEREQVFTPGQPWCNPYRLTGLKIPTN